MGYWGLPEETEETIQESLCLSQLVFYELAHSGSLSTLWEESRFFFLCIHLSNLVFIFDQLNVTKNQKCIQPYQKEKKIRINK